MIVGTGKVEQNGQTRMTEEVQEKCKKDQRTTEVRNKVYTTNLTEKHYQCIHVLFLYLIQKFGSDEKMYITKAAALSLTFCFKEHHNN